jgi:exopolysaccharide biosynthesis polyprenyl glycosylphosphotransferase
MMAVDAHAESEAHALAGRSAGAGRPGTGFRLLAAEALMLAAAAIVIQAALGPGVAPRQWPAYLAIVLPVWIASGLAYGLYEDERNAVRRSSEFKRVFHAATISVWLACAASWLLLGRGEVRPYFVLWALVLIVIPLVRGAIRRAGEQRQPERTLIVGAGEVGQMVARKLLGRPGAPVELVGFVDDHPRPLADDLKELPVFAAAGGFADVVRSLNVERVLLAFSREPQQEAVDLVRSLDRSVHVEIVPRLFEIVGPSATVDDVEGIPLIALANPTYTRFSRLSKRALDVVGAASALVVLSPLVAFVAWRIKRDSPGPVFFRQTRLGQDMKPFTMLKFRSMQEGTASGAHERAIADLMKGGVTPGENHLYKVERTDAITPIGRWIRRTSIDELPQLINVLRGEMSLVGPRPCIPYEVQHFRPHHFQRFEMPAGITGLWQATVRARASFNEALELDVIYVRSWRLTLDLTLLLRTVGELLRRETT